MPNDYHVLPRGDSPFGIVLMIISDAKLTVKDLTRDSVMMNIYICLAVN